MDSLKTIRRVILWGRGAAAELGYSWRADTKFEFVRKHLQIGFMLVRQLMFRKPSPKWRARLRACGRCPVFHRELMTCGKPGQQWFNPYSGRMEQRGCLCPLRLKVQFEDAQCWSEDDYWKEI